MERLNESPIKEIIVTDTIPNGQRTAPIGHKLTCLTVSRLLGDAILAGEGDDATQPGCARDNTL